MPSNRTSITFTCKLDTLNVVTAVLAKHEANDYYAYEREEHWYVGLGAESSLLVDSQGKTVTVTTGSTERPRALDDSSISDIAREFVDASLEFGSRIYGQVGFNYAAHIRGQTFNRGQWPLLSLMVPRTEIVFHEDSVTVTGLHEEEVRSLYEFIKHDAARVNIESLENLIDVDTQTDTDSYIARVQRAQTEIAQGLYTKVISSRAVGFTDKVDFPATLLHGRRGNTPARTFCLSHGDKKATGFSPELVLSVKNGKVTTEPLAGTRSRQGTEKEIAQLRQELLNDPKEIVEHVISVREAVQELKQLCAPDTVIVEDLMSVRERGSVQHLGSRVAGMLASDKDIWHAFDTLFPSITASGIPKDAAIEAIQRLENQPRELYSGAVLLIEGSETLEAALVLRTVYQCSEKQWIQAGAGILAQSSPQRELIETQEKLASIAPFIMANTAA
ncbi:putative salicylate synthetase [Aspergillus clavatus NRRL 1]|uniref:Salicylate synthetase, putative n=1 Tax=Aspergillus clavatus (strain ATCC 1007 / CBS 513.65 / DSM 816 / NCTC 3887 / NRRL 1 / QM 1276 / 107) TaxID=344612 RepID=A1CCR5_ASPCL|nr:salicylate synthetase, putative [Aspergillus clavatus NRRL 1]EAW12322.1 salicylate synthetase, putative [Aspergillus clavatus NRRL 1]